MANEIGITVDQRNVDSNERQAPPRKVWAQKVAIAFMKKARGVATRVAKIYSEFPFGEPTDLNLICKIPLFVLWVVICPLVFVSRKWKRVFIASCIAISLDPLFLYIPIIDEANQCLGTDKTLRNIILVFRSFIDIVFIFHIFWLISDDMEDPTRVSESQSQETLCWSLKSFEAAIAQKIPCLSTSIVITCLAILPIPQVAILFVFFRMNGTNLFRIRSLINFALFFQFVVRIFQMYSSSKKVEKFANWIKGSFYFFLYILASHVFAAFWYFLSIQKVTSCWHQACRNSGVCLHNYNCGGCTPNSKLLNGLCSISSPNATGFNFGMYTNILQSGNTGSISFPQKFFYYFWWGLKNLSNFGTNLETSSNLWENYFAIIICITGLLLFLYLIGNVQLYIQMYMQRKAEKLAKKKIEEAKIEEANHEFMENWMTSHGLHDYIKEIRRHIAKVKAWELSNKHIDTKFMIDSLCTIDTERIFSEQHPFEIISANALRKIPGLENIQIEHLAKRYHLVNMSKGRCIARAGEPIGAMWLIIDGVIECKDAETTAARASSPTMSLQTHDYFGVELLRWAILNYKRADPDPRPVSPVTLTCQTDVIAFKFSYETLISRLEEFSLVHDRENLEKLEAWALGYNHKDSHAAAVDLKRKKQEDILDWLSRNGVPPHLKLDITNSINKDAIVETNINAEVDVKFLFSVLPEKIRKSLRCHLGVNSLMKVPMLKSMHRYVLEIICEHLKPVIYKKESYIVREGEVLGFMIFILQGTVVLTRSNATTTSSEITESSDEKILKKGDFYGEQLLMRWASPYNVSFSDHPVISTVSVECGTKVEALILKAEDLRSAVAQCGSRWNLNDCSSESKQLFGHGTDSVVDTSASAARMTSTSNEQTLQPHQGHDMILQQMVLIRETMFRRFDDVVGRLDDQGQRLDDVVGRLDDQGRRLDDQGRRLDDVVGRLDDQGRRLDEMAAFLATLGYNGTSPPPAT